MLILLGLLWTVGMPLRYFAAAAARRRRGVTALAVSAPYRLERLLTFTDPFDQRKGAGYHTVEGLYALASGGVFGVGLGHGTSKYGWVPNANTDYVFAVIGEELGLIGCVAVLALFALFAVHRPADRATQRRSVRAARRRRRDGLDLRSGRDQHRLRHRRCCRSPASRCRSSRPAAHRCSSPSSCSACSSRSPGTNRPPWLRRNAPPRQEPRAGYALGPPPRAEGLRRAEAPPGREPSPATGARRAAPADSPRTDQSGATRRSSPPGPIGGAARPRRPATGGPPTWAPPAQQRRAGRPLPPTGSDGRHRPGRPG